MDKKEKSKLNLNAPWKKGQSGNPKGKPKGAKNVSTILGELLKLKKIEAENPITGEKELITGSMIIAFKMFQMAAQGDFRAIREIIDRTEGVIDGAGLQEFSNKNKEEEDNPPEYKVFVMDPKDKDKLKMIGYKGNIDDDPEKDK